MTVSYGRPPLDRSLSDMASITSADDQSYTGSSFPDREDLDKFFALLFEKYSQVTVGGKVFVERTPAEFECKGFALTTYAITNNRLTTADEFIT